MTRKYFIAENERIPMMRLWQVLSDVGVAAEDIYPFPDSKNEVALVENWEQVVERLNYLAVERGWNPDKEEVVLLMDVILSRTDVNVQAIANFLEVVEVLKKYVLIVVSRVEKEVQSVAGERCDGYISKSVFSDSSASARTRLAEHIRRACSNCAARTGRQRLLGSFEGIEIGDGLAVRQLLATFGDHFFRDIASDFAELGRDRTQVAVMTGGYSGSAVLKISVAGAQGTSSQVVKISKRREYLEKEASSLSKAQAYAHKFGGAIVGPIGEIQCPRMRSDVFYVRYPLAEGRTLEEVLRAARVSEEGELCGAQPAIGFVAGELRSMVMAGLDDVASEFDIARGLAMSSEEIFRVAVSLDSLDPIRSRLEERLRNSQFLSLIGEQIGAVKKLLGSWESVTRKISELKPPGYLQHGDLNPRNVIVSYAGRPSLIDFSRFGVWPALYDLGRLELHMMRRQLDEEDGGEHFFDFFGVWEGLLSPTAGREQITGKHDLSKYSAWIAFQAAITQVRLEVYSKYVERQAAIAMAQAAGRFYDLLKMVSYQDASVFKRILFLALACQEAQELGKML